MRYFLDFRVICQCDLFKGLEGAPFGVRKSL
jgi:hypothetical protein